VRKPNTTYQYNNYSEAEICSLSVSHYSRTFLLMVIHFMFQNNFVYFPVYLATQLKVIRSTVWNWNTLNKELNILNSCWVGAIWKWHENLRKKGSTATLVDAKEAGEKPSRTSGVPGGVQTPPPKFRRPSKIVPNSTRLWKLLKIAEFRTPTHPDIQKKGSKIRKLPRFAIVLH